MRWSGRRQSGNVEDRRGVRPGRMVLGGGIGGIVILVIALLFGVNPGALLNLAPVETQQTGGTVPTDPREEKLKEFASVVLADTEEIWRQLFARDGRTYVEPTMVLFTGRVESACGLAAPPAAPSTARPTSGSTSTFPSSTS